MGIHKHSKAEEIRKYVRQNPTAPRQEVADKLGVSLQRVSNVLSIARRKARIKRKVGTPRAVKRTTAGIKLEGGYYTVSKLKDIVNALETLNKLMAKTAND